MNDRLFVAHSNHQSQKISRTCVFPDLGGIHGLVKPPNVLDNLTDYLQP